MSHDSKERRSSSIFKMPFRSGKDSKPSSRSSSLSGISGKRTPLRKSSLDDGPRRSSTTHAHSRLRNSVTDEYGTVYDVSQTSTNKTGSSWSSGPSVAITDSISSGYLINKKPKSGKGGEVRDKQTGEVIDHTDMLHSLVPTESQTDAPILRRMQSHEGTEPGQSVIDRFGNKILDNIISLLDIVDRSSLALSCKAFRTYVGTECWTQLALPENRLDLLRFLPLIDADLPTHLLCFDCAKYHPRTHPGTETLRPANVLNPVYECPNASNPNKVNPRIRLSMGRILPFTFLQLAMRASRFAPQYGIDLESLSRRWKDREGSGSNWSHQTRFVMIKNHLLMRVASQTFAPPGLPPSGERHLLYSREDFIPYFSVCPHWRDGVLLPMVKCALHHIPKPPEGSGVQRVATDVKLHFHPTNPIVILCENCRPMRRCPECPTEYLIEVRMTEDKSDPDPHKLFKQTLVVTRWSDLGDGTSPLSPEWAACSGMPGFEFDSFTALGKRAVSGQFEGEVYGDVIPGQKLMSMNPDKVKLGEKGYEWY